LRVFIEEKSRKSSKKQETYKSKVTQLAAEPKQMSKLGRKFDFFLDTGNSFVGALPRTALKLFDPQKLFRVPKKKPDSAQTLSALPAYISECTWMQHCSRRGMLSLLQLTQNAMKKKMRRDFIEMVKACELEYEQAEERANALEQAIPLDWVRGGRLHVRRDLIPLPVYNFRQMLRRTVPTPEHDLWSFVLDDDGASPGNRLVRFCVPSCETPMLQHRCMQFIEFVESTSKRAAAQILVRYTEDLQIEMLHAGFRMYNLHKLLSWDYELGASLTMNQHHSEMHSYMRNAYDDSVSSRRRPVAPKMTRDIFERLQVIVSHLGSAYLGYFPADHEYASNTLVTTALCHGDLSGENVVMEELLRYLINFAPETLRIFGRIDCTVTRLNVRQNNAFTAVVERCGNADDPQHRGIVESVMRHARLNEDILGIVPDTENQTLLQLAQAHNNTLVLAYIANHFGL